MYNAECTIFGLKDLSMQIENAVGRRESTKKISVDLREKIRKLVHADIRRLKAQMNAENKFA